MSEHRSWCPAHPSRQDGRCACAEAADTRTLDLFAGVEHPVVSAALAVVEEAASRIAEPKEEP